MTEELIKRLRYDCELALQLGDEARVVLPATDVRTIADTIEAQAAENERLKNILRDCDPESMSWLDARDAALGETE
jgi:hypothetical protein